MTQPRKLPSLIARIRGAMSTLHPMERRLADVLLSFPGELASYSASELARLANVSNATVSRFFRKLGYSSYEAARRHVRAEKQSGAALLLLEQGTDTLDHIIDAHAKQAQNNLSQTFAALTIAEVDSVAQSLLQARRVWILGYRSAHAFATYLQWQILQAIDGVRLLPATGQTLAEHIADIEPEDVVVIYDFKRRPTVLDKIVSAILGRGPQMVVLSDAARSLPQTQVAWHFHCKTGAAGPLFDHVAVLGLSHLLATRVLALAGPRARRRLATIETLHEDLDEL